MRTHGTLKMWNDDRGFGFIAPANGTDDVFAHISAFPRDGVRPCLNELISFEVESGSGGKLRTVRVMRAGQRTARRQTAMRGRHRREGRGLGGALAFLAIARLHDVHTNDFMRRGHVLHS